MSATGAVAMIGGGISAIQAALDLAESGYYVYLIEKSPSIGGIMSQLDKTFPTNDCAMCIMSPKLVEVGRHINIEILTLSEVISVLGEEGNFDVTVLKRPRYVDIDRCIACGLCAEKCPGKVPNDYDGGLSVRKAIYIKYPQAVPLKYTIDPDNCIFLTKGKCRACEKICPARAISFDCIEEKIDLRVGAIVLATGTSAYDPGCHDLYGCKMSPDIVTSLEIERILSASGPFKGHLVRPSDERVPKKIAWLQCVGSRDEHIGRGYCSSVCCTYAIKEAVLTKEHVTGSLDTAIFYIDMRTHGKDFEASFIRARDEMGVRFIKSRIINITQVRETGRYRISYVVENPGNRREEEFDMVVLSVGLGVTDENRKQAEILGIDLDHYGFISTSGFKPVQSSRPGIYVCGAFQSPKDIPSSVIDASAAAAVAGVGLCGARWTSTKKKEIPSKTDTRGEPPRIGVFVCSCGTNIGGTVNVPAVVEYARRLPCVVHTEENMFSCSQDTQDKMTRVIRELSLNRIVVAACTPKTHEPLFRETLINAGLNKYLFEMVNIRNHDSWVHRDLPEMATQKAMDLVRMAAAKASLLEPLEEAELEIDQKALVVGGGVAGMMAAKILAEQGYRTCLIEKGGCLGGNALNINKTWKGEDVQEYLKALVYDLESNKNIEILLNAEIENVKGFVGNFVTTVLQEGQRLILNHGVTIITCGASELKPDDYLYQKDARVITGLDLQKRLIVKDPSLANETIAVFIQCVGSRIPERPYCSKVCCTQSIRSALDLKELNPSMEVFILYRDIRTYGLREDLYREARSKNIHFIRYDHERGVSVDNDGPDLKVSFNEASLNRKMELRPGILILAAAIVPEKSNPLSQYFKISQNHDGFFAEAHVKLRPSDFATDGVFLAGLAHAPKPIDESITQAQAAAARAITLLSAKTISVEGTIAHVNQSLCSGCGICESICPYSAPSINEKSGRAEINSTLCKGCGLCTASCRSGAIRLKGFETEQIMAMINEI